MNWAHPEAFLLFLPLVALAYWNFHKGVRLRARVPYPTAVWMNSRPRMQLPTPFRVFFVLRLLALSLMIVALARPQLRQDRVKRTVEAVDIILSFDLSKSMDAIDFSPNRRAVAIQTLLQFIDRRPDDRIGLVLFSGQAYLAVPLTNDHQLLKDAIVNSNNRLLQDGTAIGQSLAVAVSHLRNSQSKSRIVVLVTDGDNNMGSVDPMTAADLAKGFGLRIYTIGIGKRGRVKFPIKQWDPVRREEIVVGEQFLTDAVNDELLAQIASHTGGRSFRAESANVLSEVFETISKLEKTKVETETLTRIRERAWPWILAALILLLAEGLALNTRWRKFP
jgi:Ca-activated chloride channel family protein